MTRRLIRYQAKPEAVEKNAELVADVFKELHAAAPAGVGYLVLRAADGTFFHYVRYEDEAANDRLTDLPAFAAFRAGGSDRRLSDPIAAEVTIVGSYGMPAEER